MYKRMSIRIVTTLSEDLITIAKKRGLSVNSLISEMAWDFVEAWKTKYNGIGENVLKHPSSHKVEIPQNQ